MLFPPSALLASAFVTAAPMKMSEIIDALADSQPSLSQLSLRHATATERHFHNSKYVKLLLLEKKMALKVSKMEFNQKMKLKDYDFNSKLSSLFSLKCLNSTSLLC